MIISYSAKHNRSCSVTTYSRKTREKWIKRERDSSAEEMIALIFL